MSNKICLKCQTPRSRGVPRCLTCQVAYNKQLYEKKKALGLWKGNEAKQKLADKNARFILDYLLSHPCISCSEADPLVLDFDHTDPGTKLGSIATQMSHWGLERLKTEIAKCVVRCANCHRRKTAIENNFRRYQLLEEKRLNAK